MSEVVDILRARDKQREREARRRNSTTLRRLRQVTGQKGAVVDGRVVIAGIPIRSHYGSPLEALNRSGTWVQIFNVADLGDLVEEYYGQSL